MRRRWIVLAVAVLLSPLALAEGETDVKVRVAAFRTAMKSRDPAARIQAVRELGDTRHEDVAKALSRHLGDEHPGVRAAVARALGAQGAPKYVGKLLGRLRRWEKDDPEAVIGCLEGLALLPDESAVGDLAGVVRKILSATRFGDQPVGLAAVAALGKIREKKAVDALTDLLDLTRPLGPLKGYPTDQHRVFRTALRSAIHRALFEMTDRCVKVTDVWQSWWKKAASGFEFPTARSDVNAGPRYEDPAYGFVLARPGDAWTFTRLDSDHVIVRLIHRAGSGASDWDVEVLVEAYAVSEYSTKTPAAAAAHADAWAEADAFKKGADGRPMIRSGPETLDARIAGQPAKLWRTTGTNPWGKETTLQKYFFLREGLLYTLTIETNVGVADEIRAELDTALVSFSFSGR